MLQARNDSELLNHLSSLGTSVPLRSEGRTKDHTERYTVVRLLSSLIIKTDLIRYPLTLVQRERPDFLLSMDTVQIGIEHTEAVPQNEAHKTVLREKNYRPDMHFLSRSIPGERRKSHKELQHEIDEENSSGAIWEGDSVEREWVDAMFYFITHKVTKLKSDGFKRFDRGWLLIYDNWMLPRLDLEVAAPRLRTRVNSSGCLDEFESIFILTGSKLCKFSRCKLCIFNVNDLWS